MENSDVIKTFMSGYEREFDFFDQAARLVHGVLEAKLSSSGIASIVTYRAKNPDRLEQKLLHRNETKNYKDHDEIYNDIADFSGVRVALYFPGTREEVKRIIEANFIIEGEIREFPQPIVDSEGYKKRFSGYGATHYRVHLKSSKIDSQHKRYAAALVEIQIASVLMHAWSEVEHDLIYKPEQGPLSLDEYAILDELNGLVLAGEIALERLQNALRQRLDRDQAKFASRFELATWLLNTVSDYSANTDDRALGQVDTLYVFLRVLQLDSPKKLKPYVEGLGLGNAEITLADQIVERISEGNEKKYTLFRNINIKFKNKISSSSPDGGKDDMGPEFIRLWVQLEKVVGISIVKESEDDGRILIAKKPPGINWSNKLIEDYRFLLKVRNAVIHGRNVSDDFVLAAIQRLKNLIGAAVKLKEKNDKKPKK